jgi:hypothetical protein
VIERDEGLTILAVMCTPGSSWRSRSARRMMSIIEIPFFNGS